MPKAMQHIMLDPALCVIDPAINARSGDGGDLSGLKAQIRQNGFTDPLWVMKRGKKYSIIDGGRRWRAALEIAKEDRKKPGKIPVSLFDVTDAVAVEMSLAAFLERDALTPHDEAVQFTRLKRAGLDEADIAARFAVTPRLVKQRIAIGSLPAPILKALKEGGIEVGAAQMFTAGSSAHALEVFNALKKQKNLTRFAIERALFDGQVAGADPRCVFVGAEAYEAAGGVVSRDLFSDDAMWSDAKLLDSLFEAKLTETAQALRDAGWSFVDILRTNTWKIDAWAKSVGREPRVLTKEEKAELKQLKVELKSLAAELTRLDDKDGEEDLSDADQQRYDALPDLIDACEARIAELDAPLFTQRQMQKAGCVICADGHSAVRIVRGLIKPGKKADPDEDLGDALPVTSVAAAVAETAAYSDALTASLEDFARDATMLAMVAHKPMLTYRLGLAARILVATTYSSQGAPFNVSHNASLHGPAYEKLKLQAFQPFGGFVDDDGQTNEPLTHAAVTGILETLHPEAIIQIEAVLAADLFRVSSLKNPDVRAVIEMIDPDMAAEGWHPDAEFMGRLNRPQLVAVIAEIDPERGTPVSTRKPELMEIARSLAELHGWLPPPLRTASYKGPGSNAWAQAKADQAADAISSQQQAAE
jgi:ParB family chromosome partitioning protein